MAGGLFRPSETGDLCTGDTFIDYRPECSLRTRRCRSLSDREHVAGNVVAREVRNVSVAERVTIRSALIRPMQAYWACANHVGAIQRELIPHLPSGPHSVYVSLCISSFSLFFWIKGGGYRPNLLSLQSRRTSRYVVYVFKADEKYVNSSLRNLHQRFF